MRPDPASGGETRQELSIQVPASAEFMSTARLFASALGRHAGCDDAACEDLKLAVSEACATTIQLRAGRTGAQPVTVRATLEPSRLTFQVEGAGELLPVGAPLDDEGSLSEASTGDMVHGLRVEVIKALFPDVEVVQGSGGTRDIRFSLERPGV